MKRVTLLTLGALLCLPAFVSRGYSEEDWTAYPRFRTAARSSRFFSISLFTPLQIVPEEYEISGLRLNLLYGSNKSMEGIDLGLVNRTTDLMMGLGIGLVNRSPGDASGLRIGLANLMDAESFGYQVGLYNRAGRLTGIQFGLVNRTARSAKKSALRSIQIGLLNFSGNMDSGGMQFGLLNFVSEGDSAGVTPLFKGHY